MKHPGESSVLMTMLIVAGLGAAVPARADIQFFTGIQGGNQGTDNVLYNGPTDILGPALTVRGHVQSGPQVDFVGLENLQVLIGGGQAKIMAEDGGFTDLTILLTVPPGGTFTKAIFNLDASADGQVTIGVVEGNGNSASATFGLDGNGNNFFTTLAINGQDIRNITIGSTVDIADIEQVRLGGITAIPEPAAIALLGTVLLGVGALRKRLLAN